MKILAIETSCDETSVAIVSDGPKILALETVSQIPIHRKYGGVVPEIASRNHTLAILDLLEKTIQAVFKKEKFQNAMKKIDALAVTTGPGLIGSLLVGINTAKTFGFLAQKPIYPINHLEGHIYANWINPVGESPNIKAQSSKSRHSESELVEDEESQWDPSVASLPQDDDPKIQFPAICLIVSGGHTMLVKMTDHRKYQILGSTLDDAAGEAFDKVAKLLKLSYPGGPEIEKRAKLGDPKTYNLPIPMQKDSSLNFSFAGLKTAVLYLTRKTSNLKINDLCANFQDVLIESLILKSLKAVKIHKPKSFLLSGGVINNQILRKKFEKRFKKNFPNLPIYFPPKSLCTDNAAMIGAAAYFHSLKTSGKNWYDIDIDTDSRGLEC